MLWEVGEGKERRGPPFTVLGYSTIDRTDYRAIGHPGNATLDMGLEVKGFLNLPCFVL